MNLDETLRTQIETHFDGTSWLTGYWGWYMIYMTYYRIHEFIWIYDISFMFRKVWNHWNELISIYPWYPWQCNASRRLELRLCRLPWRTSLWARPRCRASVQQRGYHEGAWDLGQSWDVWNLLDQLWSVGCAMTSFKPRKTSQPSCHRT